MPWKRKCCCYTTPQCKVKWSCKATSILSTGRKLMVQVAARPGNWYKNLQRGWLFARSIPGGLKTNFSYPEWLQSSGKMCERKNTKSKWVYQLNEWFGLGALSTSTMGLKWRVVQLHLLFATLTEEQKSERKLWQDFLLHMGHIQAAQFASRTEREYIRLIAKLQQKRKKHRQGLELLHTRPEEAPREIEGITYEPGGLLMCFPKHKQLWQLMFAISLRHTLNESPVYFYYHFLKPSFSRYRFSAFE